jgi:heme/copper-type cytochrome/quinol oxidase subunit 4
MASSRLYCGDSPAGGDTYIKFNGGEVDADLAGGIALSIAALAVVLSVVVLKRLALSAFAGIAFAVALLSGVYGIWLVTTPDYDGGRQAVGAMLTAFAAVIAVVAVAIVWASRRRPLCAHPPRHR